MTKDIHNHFSRLSFSQIVNYYFVVNNYWFNRLVFFLYDFTLVLILWYSLHNPFNILFHYRKWYTFRSIVMCYIQNTILITQALHYYKLLIIMKWRKKWIDFVGELSSILIKILNDIACNFNWIVFNSIFLFKFNSNSIEWKWDGIENMFVASIICGYGIEKKTT